jgi:phage tail sheath gpL-like
MPPIQNGIRTPGIYTDVNINTLRRGLIANEHKVLFISDDAKQLAVPVAVYDEEDAKEKISAGSKIGKMIKAALKTNRLIDAYAQTILLSGDPAAADLDATIEQIEAFGHTIIALASAPTVGDSTEAWIDHLDFISGPIEQRPSILVVPFTDIEEAEAFAAQAPVETSYRVVAACYHGATGQEAEIAGAVSAILADSNDPALPFNGVKLQGVEAVDVQHKLTFERQERAMKAGVCIITTGHDGKPEILRALSTYRKNPTTGLSDDLMMDINGALTIDYFRKVVRNALAREPRRKNTAANRRNVRSIILTEAIKLDNAEILQNVKERKDELTVNEDATDRYRVNAKIPADWVRGMHIIAATLDVY